MAKRGKKNRQKKAKRAQIVDQILDQGKAPYIPLAPKEILPVQVFTLEKCTVWGGDVHARDVHKWAAIICLGVHEAPARHDQFETRNGADLVFPDATARISNLTAAPEIYLNWPDYAGPPVDATAEFWIALLGDLKHVEGDVLVHCMGGHGRTGTALAAMIHLAPSAGLRAIVPPGDCIVDWVRKNYSPTAIESGDQGDYLTKIGATVSRKVQSELDWNNDWWHNYSARNHDWDGLSGTASDHVNQYGAKGAGWGYDAATGVSTYTPPTEYCDMCGTHIAGMSIRTPLGLYCSDNCEEHDAIMHSDNAKATKALAQSADPTCDCANYGGAASCAQCDPDWIAADRAGGER